MLRNFIPYSYADFIYAIICEEGGLILGGIVIILLYVALLFQCTRIVTMMPKTFGAMLAIGIGLNIVVQAFAEIPPYPRIGACDRSDSSNGEYGWVIAIVYMHFIWYDTQRE